MEYEFPAGCSVAVMVICPSSEYSLVDEEEPRLVRSSLVMVTW